jgi:hypothetical protein
VASPGMFSNILASVIFFISLNINSIYLRQARLSDDDVLLQWKSNSCKFRANPVFQKRNKELQMNATPCLPIA